MSQTPSLDSGLTADSALGRRFRSNHRLEPRPLRVPTAPKVRFPQQSCHVTAARLRGAAPSLSAERFGQAAVFRVFMCTSASSFPRLMFSCCALCCIQTRISPVPLLVMSSCKKVVFSKFHWTNPFGVLKVGLRPRAASIQNCRESRQYPKRSFEVFSRRLLEQQSGVGDITPTLTLLNID